TPPARRGRRRSARASGTGVRVSPLATYHARGPASLYQRGLRSCLGLSLLLGALGTGCAHWTGRLAVGSVDSARSGSKLLRRDARASVCRTRIFGMTLGTSAATLDEAVRSLLALDPEADALADVRVESRQMTAGVFDRSCVTVQANVVRQISVV